MVSIEKIKDAAEKLSIIARKTPIYDAPKLGENVYIKMENLQFTGSFKLRGAFNKIANLTEEEAKKGVIACSAGNHAQGVALSATRLGIKSYICIPSVAPLSKIEATRGFGGEVLIAQGVYDDAYNLAIKVQKEKELTFVHPFNDEYVIAGQGTVGLEILEQLPDVDIIVAPIGGGGLVAGIACAVKALKPNVRVIGVQASGAASMRKSLDKGKIITLDSVKTIADGISVKTPGDLTYQIIKDLGVEVVTVTDDEISSAILKLMEENKVIAEGAGATPIAALMYNKFDYQGKKVCCLLSGGNINVTTLSKIITTGLYKTDRLAEIQTMIEDRPGSLNKFLAIIAESGANIINIEQSTRDERMDLYNYAVRVVVETRNKAHKDELYDKLKKLGYKHFK